MKKIVKAALLIAFLSGLMFFGVEVARAERVGEKPSLGILPSLKCVSAGGTWVGVSGEIGVCTFPPGSLGHTNFGGCSSEQYTLEIWTSHPAGGITRTVTCKNISSVGYGKCGNEANKTEDSATLVTCHGTSVTFDADACTGKCTVGPKVLNTAKKGLSQLDGEVLGEAYVKVRNPSGGSYKICMPGEGTIYKWVSGAWVAQATQTVGGVSCAWSSGDGNYVLVANP